MGGTPFKSFICMLITSFLMAHWAWATWLAWGLSGESSIYNTFLIISAGLVFMQQWSYVAVRCSDPGLASEDPMLDFLPNQDQVKLDSEIVATDEQILLDLINSKERHYSTMHNLSFVPAPPVTREKLIDQLRKLRLWKCCHNYYCTKCQKFRLLRSHHSSALGTCVSRMDQYCSWLDNCIGKKNQRYFIQYLSWTFATLVWSCFH